MTTLTRFTKFKAIASYYYDWLNHPTYDSYWRNVSLEHQYANVVVPTLSYFLVKK